MSDERRDPDDPLRELPRPGERPGETLARALGNAERKAEERGGKVLAVYVVALLDFPPDDDDPAGAEALLCESTPAAGPARRMGMLLWALDVERAA